MSMIGAKVYRSKLFARHYAIVIDSRRTELRVVENVPGRGVVESLWPDVREGVDFWVEQRAPRGRGAGVACRALGLVGRNYDLASFNCEHAANLAFSGVPTSSQVDAVSDVAKFIGLMALGGWGLNVFLGHMGAGVGSDGYRRDRRGRFA